MGSRRTRSLGEIARIRALQRQAGEMQARRAAAALADQLGRQEAEQEKQDDRERLWREAVDGGFDLALSRAWSGAVAEGLQELATVGAIVAEARLESDSAARALQAAHAKSEAADTLEQRADRRDRRALENRSFLDLSDHFARRRGHED